MVDVELMEACGDELAERLEETQPTKARGRYSWHVCGTVGTCVVVRSGAYSAASSFSIRATSLTLPRRRVVRGMVLTVT